MKLYKNYNQKIRLVILVIASQFIPQSLSFLVNIALLKLMSLEIYSNILIHFAAIQFFSAFAQFAQLDTMKQASLAKYESLINKRFISIFCCSLLILFMTLKFQFKFSFVIIFIDIVLILINVFANIALGLEHSVSTKKFAIASLKFNSLKILPSFFYVYIATSELDFLGLNIISSSIALIALTYPLKSKLLTIWRIRNMKNVKRKRSFLQMNNVSYLTFILIAFIPVGDLFLAKESLNREAFEEYAIATIILKIAFFSGAIPFLYFTRSSILNISRTTKEFLIAMFTLAVCIHLLVIFFKNYIYEFLGLDNNISIIPFIYLGISYQITIFTLQKIVFNSHPIVPLIHIVTTLVAYAYLLLREPVTPTILVNALIIANLAISLISILISQSQFSRQFTKILPIIMFKA